MLIRGRVLAGSLTGVTLGSVLVLSLNPFAAIAQAPACEEYDQSGICLIWAGGPGSADPPGTDPVSGGGSSGGNGGSGGEGGSDGPKVPTVTVDGQECIPGGPSNPQPKKGNPVWAGNDDGAIYDCYTNTAAAGGFVAPITLQFWAAEAPSAAPPPPDPAVLAAQAVEAMQLRAIDIGIIPIDEPGSVGLVGIPQWMWVEDPGESTTGPITRSASAQGYTVTATATLDHINWDMGNGEVVRCSSIGIPYEDVYAFTESPQCGHPGYVKQGSYGVSATSYWVVEWAGIGQTGTIPLDFSRDTQIEIGEAQSVITN